VKGQKKDHGKAENAFDADVGLSVAASAAGPCALIVSALLGTRRGILGQLFTFPTMIWGIYTFFCLELGRPDLFLPNITALESVFPATSCIRNASTLSPELREALARQISVAAMLSVGVVLGNALVVARKKSVGRWSASHIIFMSSLIAIFSYMLYFSSRQSVVEMIYYASNWTVIEIGVYHTSLIVLVNYAVSLVFSIFDGNDHSGGLLNERTNQSQRLSARLFLGLFRSSNWSQLGLEARPDDAVSASRRGCLYPILSTRFRRVGGMPWHCSRMGAWWRGGVGNSPSSFSWTGKAVNRCGWLHRQRGGGFAAGLASGGPGIVLRVVCGRAHMVLGAGYSQVLFEND
jgi:hypothetical protein